MTPLWLLSIGGTLKNGAVAALGWIRANPLLALVIGLSLALAWTYHGKHKAEQRIVAIEAAQKAATGAQKRVNQAATKHYEDAANAADTHHDAMVADAFDVTADYIAKHRVRPADRTCKAAPAASGSDPQIPAEPAASSVVVAQADVETCAADYTYARSAYDWAQSLKLPEDLLPEK